MGWMDRLLGYLKLAKKLPKGSARARSEAVKTWEIINVIE
jgi:hypothetical protein